jgi:adenylate kinase
MWIALTGTPGTGKTATADWLKHHDITVIDLKAYATQSGCITGEDTQRDTKIVDIDCITTKITHDFDPNQTIIFEGLFAHLLPTTYVIILRCHPTTLRTRLQQRPYTPAKIKENVDAETLDIILCEATDFHTSDHLYEIDTTTKTPQQTGAIILDLITHNFPPPTDYKIGTIDWSDEILRQKNNEE